jgi:hypothetical protein
MDRGLHSSSILFVPYFIYFHNSNVYTSTIKFSYHRKENNRLFDAEIIFLLHMHRYRLLDTKSTLHSSGRDRIRLAEVSYKGHTEFSYIGQSQKQFC